MARTQRKKAANRSRRAMKKKSPAQLDREIAEALSRGSRRSHSTKTIKIEMPPIYCRVL